MGAGNQIAIIFGFKEAAQCFLIQYQSFRFFRHGDPPVTGLILAFLIFSASPRLRGEFWFLVVVPLRRIALR
jgi:hypothetical protein